MELQRCSINSITMRSLALPALVDAVGKRGIPAMAPWRELIEPYGAAKAGRMIRDGGLEVSSLCRGGMLTASTEAGRRQAIDDNARAIDQAHDIGADVLAFVCGGVVGRDLPGTRAMIRDGIEALLPYARQADVRLGIEPVHPMMAADRSAVTSLREANDLWEEISDGGLGVIIDVYHVWWEAGLAEQIVRAAGRTVGLHVSDWVVPIDGHLSSRGMLGDGCIDISQICEQVLANGYEGYVEVEILSDYWWRQSPGEVVDTICERFRSVI